MACLDHGLPEGVCPGAGPSWALLGPISLRSGTGVGAPERVPPLLSGGPKQSWRAQ